MDWEYYDTDAVVGRSALTDTLKGLKYEDAVQYVRDYVWAFIDHGMPRFLEADEASRSTFDVAVLTDGEALDSLTKRTSLIADRLVLAHSTSGNRIALPVRTQRRPAGDLSDWYRKQRVSVRVPITSSSHSKTTAPPGVVRLATYLQGIMPFILTEQLTYFPNLDVQEYDYDDSPDSLGWGRMGMGDPVNDERATLRHFTDFVVAGRRILQDESASLVRRRLVTPILELNLPIIEGTSLRDFCDLATGEAEAFRRAQNHLREQLLLFDVTDEDSRDLNVATLDLRLRDAVDDLSSQTRALVRRNSVRAAGGVFATAAATLVAISGEDLANIVSIVGLSGGAWSVITAAEQYAEDRQRLRQNPWYFFWLLDKQRSA